MTKSKKEVISQITFKKYLKALKIEREQNIVLKQAIEQFNEKVRKLEDVMIKCENLHLYIQYDDIKQTLHTICEEIYKGIAGYGWEILTNQYNKTLEKGIIESKAKIIKHIINEEKKDRKYDEKN